MAIDPRTGAILAGGALGAYTSDITENPITGIVSTGIGAAMGGLTILPKTNSVREMVSVATGIALDTNEILNRAASNKVPQHEEVLKKYHTYIDNITQLHTRVASGINVTDADKALLSGYSTNLNNIPEVLRDRFPGIQNNALSDPIGFLNSLKNISDKDTITKILPLLSNKDELFVSNLHSQSTNIPRFEKGPRQLIREGNKGDMVKQLSEIFQTQMGNSIEEAQAKAAMFVNRAKGSIVVEDGNVVLNDIDNRSVKVPVTAYDKNGVRYHNTGNGKLTSVKGFSPFVLLKKNDIPLTHNGITRQITSEEVLKGMSPEMMIDFLGKDKPISSLLDNIKRHHAYDSREVGEEFFTGKGVFEAKSATFINNSNTVTTDTVLNSEYGEVNSNRPFRKLSLISTESNIVSELQSVKNNLGHILGEGSRFAGVGISGNSSTDMQGQRLSTISMFAQLERNPGGATARDVLPTVESYGTKAVHDVFDVKGADRLYSSAQVFEKLDIKDEKAFNALSTALLGDNSSVLADGFGLYNRKHGDMFANKSIKDVVIPMSTSTIIKDKVLFEAIESGDINGYIQTNGPIQVGNGTLAYTPDGREIGIGRQHTSGGIVNAFIKNNNELVLRTETVFHPNQENLVKLFSVGSKALAKGVSEKDFNLLTALGSLLNTGQVTYQDDMLKIGENATDAVKNLFVINKRQVDGLGIDQIRALKDNKDFMDLFSKKTVSLITSASRTGMDTLQDMLGNLNHSLMQSTGAPTGQAISHQISAITGFLTAETKASEDITAHVTSNLLKPLYKAQRGKASVKDLARLKTYYEKGIIPQAIDNKSTGTLIEDAVKHVSGAFRSALDVEKFLAKDIKVRKQAMNDLYRFVDAAAVHEDLKYGFSTAIGSTYKGSAGVGAGNRARVSWNAYRTMRDAGYSKEQLSWLGSVDNPLHYEMQGLLSETTRGGNKAFNSIIKGQEDRAETLLHNSLPEERLTKFTNTFKDFAHNENPYLTYDLSYDKSEIKSLNFSLNSSNRSGKYEIGDKIITKELDKQRLNIMSLDIQYTAATGKEKARLENELAYTLDKYNKYSTGMFGGDNNILKNSLSLYTDQSKIRMAQPIGGVAKDLIESVERNADGSYKAISNTAFMSQEGIDDLSKQLGVQTIYKDHSDPKYKGLKFAGYLDDDGKFVPYSLMNTREPAQGRLSSQLMDVMLDTSLKDGANSVYLAQGQYGFTVGQNGDFDQDTFQSINRKLSRHQYDELSKVSQTIRESHKPHLNIEGDMSPKSQKKGVKTLSAFKDIEEFDAYQVQASAKGKIRKNLSPFATIMATHYNTALALEYGDDIDKKTLAGIGTYRSIENLIKSSHIDTDSLVKGGTTHPIEELSIAREKYLRQGGTVEEYKGVMEKHLPGILGQDLENPAKAELNKSVDKAVELIVNAELKQSKVIDRGANSPLDIDRLSDRAGLHGSVIEAMEAQDMFDMNRGTDMKRSARQLYQGLNDAIVDGIKSNKGMLALGVAALVGVNMMGRSSPSFDDSRAAMRQHSTKMLQAPTSLEDIETGIETNKTKSNYITPNSYTGSKSVDMQGQFVDNSYNNYNQFSSMLDPSIDTQKANLNSAIFGGGLRTSRLDITDL